MAALKLRLGLVGGATGALIGPVHRLAARMDDRFELLAGVFSRDPARLERFIAAGFQSGMVPGTASAGGLEQMGLLLIQQIPPGN